MRILSRSAVLIGLAVGAAALAPRLESRTGPPHVAQRCAPEADDAPLFAPRCHRDFRKKKVRPPRSWADRSRPCAIQLFEAEQRAQTEGVVDVRRYLDAWYCFTDHQQALVDARVVDVRQFRYLLGDFEGSDAQTERLLGLQPTLAHYPSWYRPAAGGIELRIQQLTVDDVWWDTLSERIGESLLAGMMARDLLLEALAAEGLSRAHAEQSSPALADLWARRVYVASWALRGPSGGLIRAHRPRMHAEIERLLREAVTGDVPPAVVEARLVALGQREPPDGCGDDLEYCACTGYLEGCRWPAGCVPRRDLPNCSELIRRLDPTLRLPNWGMDKSGHRERYDVTTTEGFCDRYREPGRRFERATCEGAVCGWQALRPLQPIEEPESGSACR